MEPEQLSLLQYYTNQLINFAYYAKCFGMSNRLAGAGRLDEPMRLPETYVDMPKDVADGIKYICEVLGLHTAEDASYERGRQAGAESQMGLVAGVRIELQNARREIENRDKWLQAIKEDADRLIIGLENTIDDMLRTEATHSERRGQLKLLQSQIRNTRHYLGTSQDDIPF